MTLSDRQRAFLWILWAAAAVGVIVGSLLPGSSPVLEAVSIINDKLLHFGAYAVLALLPVIAARNKPAAALAVLMVVALGLVLEFFQKLVPGRSFDMTDFLADDLGVLTGVCVGLVAGLAKPQPR